MRNIAIIEAVCSIKEMIERAILEGGVEGKNNLIRSQQPICLLHDAAKSAFIQEGINPNRKAPLPQLGSMTFAFSPGATVEII